MITFSLWYEPWLVVRVRLLGESNIFRTIGILHIIAHSIFFFPKSFWTPPNFCKATSMSAIVPVDQEPANIIMAITSWGMFCLHLFWLLFISRLSSAWQNCMISYLWWWNRILSPWGQIQRSGFRFPSNIKKGHAKASSQKKRKQRSE